MDHVLLPLEDVQGYLSAVSPFTALEEIKEKDYLKIIEVYVELLDEIDVAMSVEERQLRAKGHVLFVLTKDDVQLALLETN